MSAAARVVKPRVQPPASRVFDFPRLNAVVEVTSSVDGVVIRASRNCFTEERKQAFIRELAAEGFIDEACCWLPAGSLGGVLWLVDVSGFMPDAASAAQTRRFMLRLLFSVAGLWLCLMDQLLLHMVR